MDVSLHGMHTVARHCLKEMEQQGLIPIDVAFTSILSACNHAENIEEGYDYFNLMKDQYGIQPSIEHYNCMVDLFGRAGNLDIAVAMIKKVPISDYLPIWISLLGACQKWRNVKLGLLAFENVVCWKKNHAAAYVCMGNIYAMKEEENNI